jgi:hypothetical protein
MSANEPSLRRTTVIDPDSSAEFLEATGRWRARDVSYWAGRWDRLSRLVPTFTIEPFKVHPDSPANPHIKVVVRQPLTVTEQQIPVGTVSNSYQLAQHHDVVEHCFDGLRLVGVDPVSLKCEVGLTPLGEWMNFRAYFPESHNHTPVDGKPLGLRLECFNSVDGSSRLVILLGWLRFVCANGLVIGETKAELRDVHDENLNLAAIPEIIVAGMNGVGNDLQRIRGWEAVEVASTALTSWANGKLAAKWGKKAACRVFHICTSGSDVELLDPFAKGEATEKPVKSTIDVPGAACPAKTLYDVSQALSWIATQRTNTEERVEWQSAIPELIGSLRNAA